MYFNRPTLTPCCWGKGGHFSLPLNGIASPCSPLSLCCHGERYLIILLDRGRNLDSWFSLHHHRYRAGPLWYCQAGMKSRLFIKLLLTLQGEWCLISTRRGGSLALHSVLLTAVFVLAFCWNSVTVIKCFSTLLGHPLPVLWLKGEFLESFLKNICHITFKSACNFWDFKWNWMESIDQNGMSFYNFESCTL